MNWQVLLASAGVSAVVSALVTGFVSRRNSERTIQIENITKERAKWRDKIREFALGVQQAATAKDIAKLKQARLGFCLSLNPLDGEDGGILTTIDKLGNPQAPDTGLQEFSDRVALLLKHDWERAKREAKPWVWFRHAAKRMSYDAFRAEYRPKTGQTAEIRRIADH
jgi:hypothetical protein